MTAMIHPFPARKQHRSLAERAAEIAKERTTEKLQAELAVNLSEAIKARRERIRKEFMASAGIVV